MVKLTAVGSMIQLDPDDGLWSYFGLKYWTLCIISGLTLALFQEEVTWVPPLCSVHLQTVADSVPVMLWGVFITVGQRMVSEISITTESLQLVISAHALLRLVLYRLQLLWSLYASYRLGICNCHLENILDADVLTVCLFTDFHLPNSKFLVFIFAKPKLIREFVHCRVVLLCTKQLQ